MLFFVLIIAAYAADRYN
jgi:hypothetical protein